MTTTENARHYRGAIIDGHAHVGSTRFIPLAFLEGVVANVAAKMIASGVRSVDRRKLLDQHISQNQDHQADELVAEMDQAKIDKTVLLLPDFTHVMASDLDYETMCREHAAILKRHPNRFEVFAGPDPRWGQSGLDLFERYVRDHGFTGLKLYPPCGYSPSDPILFPYYELCEAYGLPVLLHTGPTSPAMPFTFAEPINVDDAAYRFPKVHFILAHGGVQNVGPSVALCAYRANVYLDVSAFLGSPHPQGWIAAMRELFQMNINHKIIFGTDWPVFRGQGGHKKTLDAFTGPEGPLTAISPFQAKWIMCENIKRLLPPREQAGLPNKPGSPGP